MKWGIIGAGSIAEAFVKDLPLAKEAKGKVVAVLSHKKESAQKFAREFQVPGAFTEFDPFIDTPLDAVYIATPHTSHFKYVMQCLQQKIPVLCEKPMGINTEQVQKMVECSRINNSFLMEGMWVRFLPSIQKVLSLIQEGIIGDVVSVKGSMSYVAPQDADNRYYNPKLGGGSLLDLGIYPLFLSLLLLGIPSAIKATGRLSEDGIDETCSALLQYQHGAYAFIESSIITKTALAAEIAGLKGAIRILPPWNETPASIELEIYNKTTKNFPCKWPGKGFQFQVDEVYRNLAAHKLYSNSFDHSFSINMVMAMDEIRSQLGVKYALFE